MFRVAASVLHGGRACESYARRAAKGRVEKRHGRVVEAVAEINAWKC